MSLPVTNFVQTHNISNSRGAHNVDNSYSLPLNMVRARKPNRSTRRSTSTTSSALALLAFLFFLNVLQRSLDDNKQGPVVMTRTTKPAAVRPRNDFIKHQHTTVDSVTRDNIMVTKFEKIYNNHLK